MLSPEARGSLSEHVLHALRTGSTTQVGTCPRADSAEDAQLTLWVLYELHHGGFEDVADALEWDPQLIALRRKLEDGLEAALRARVDPPPQPGTFEESFFAFVADHDGPSLAGYVQKSATFEQVCELLKHKSIYHLKEADHTTWVVPRLPNRVKAAVVELQIDEYGCGDPNRLHAHLFERGMEDSGLRPDYGAYIDQAPAEILEQNNTMSMFGLNRRLRAASLGFLAAFELTSSAPARRFARGLERLGFPGAMVHYYTEHVEADAVHEQLAVRTICAALLAETPALHDDVYFGAAASMNLEDRYANRMLTQWSA